MSEENNNPRKLLLLGSLAVVLLTLAAHVTGLQGQFVDWDDTSHITRNVAIRELTFENLRIMFTQPIAKLYAPLTWLSFAVDHAVWDRNPLGYHLTNLLLHIGNSLLVLVIVQSLLRGRSRNALAVAILTAILFGVHPLRVESVAWITERKDVLFGFFYLFALIIYQHWIKNQKRANYWLCFALFIASALSKSAAVTLPFVLLLLDKFVSRRRAFVEKLPFFIVGGIIGVATVVAQGSGTGQTVADTTVIPLVDRLGLVGFCSTFYMTKFLWPTHLSAIYPTFSEMNWGILTTIGYGCAFLLLTGAVILLRQRLPLLLPCWLFYLITLLPTIGLMPVGIHVVADRYSYIPLLGLCVIFSTGCICVIRWANTRQKPVVLLVSSIIALIILCLTYTSAKRSLVWQNTETLFQNAIEENPDCLPAHIKLCFVYTKQKEYDKAIVHGKRAVEIAPNGLIGRTKLAVPLMQVGQHKEAIKVLLPIVNHGIDDPLVWRLLGESFMEMKDWVQAEISFEKALRHPGKHNDYICTLLETARTNLPTQTP